MSQKNFISGGLAAFKFQIISLPKLNEIVITVKEEYLKKTTSLVAW
jgi:hypothetical protein